jgi:ABC-2 type transport system permease protein
MMRWPSTPGYLATLARLNIGAALARPFLAVTSAAMMLGNNLILSLIWVIYFANFSSLRGWALDDLMLLMGIVAWAFGLTIFLLAGVRDLAQTIVSGGLDLHLGRPRHPLPSLLMSRSGPAGLGDLASALIFWFWLAGRGPGDLPLLILVATAAAVIVAATATASQCLVFWLPGAVPLCEELFNTFLMVAFYPQHPFGFTVRLMLFTVFPTAFVALLPVEAVREADPLKVLALLAAALFYGWLAIVIFERGLRRYASGNQMLELR